VSACTAVHSCHRLLVRQCTTGLCHVPCSGFTNTQHVDHCMACMMYYAALCQAVRVTCGFKTGKLLEYAADTAGWPTYLPPKDLRLGDVWVDGLGIKAPWPTITHTLIHTARGEGSHQGCTTHGTQDLQHTRHTHISTMPAHTPCCPGCTFALSLSTHMLACMPAAPCAGNSKIMLALLSHSLLSTP
jgi:hypothetical protein